MSNYTYFFYVLLMGNGLFFDSRTVLGQENTKPNETEVASEKIAAEDQQGYYSYLKDLFSPILVPSIGLGYGLGVLAALRERYLGSKPPVSLTALKDIILPKVRLGEDPESKYLDIKKLEQKAQDALKKNFSQGFIGITDDDALHGDKLPVFWIPGAWFKSFATSSAASISSPSDLTADKQIDDVIVQAIYETLDEIIGHKGYVFKLLQNIERDIPKNISLDEQRIQRALKYKEINKEIVDHWAPIHLKLAIKVPLTMTKWDGNLQLQQGTKNVEPYVKVLLETVLEKDKHIRQAIAESIDQHVPLDVPALHYDINLLLSKNMDPKFYCTLYSVSEYMLEQLEIVKNWFVHAQADRLYALIKEAKAGV